MHGQATAMHCMTTNFGTDSWSLYLSQTDDSHTKLQTPLNTRASATTAGAGLAKYMYDAERTLKLLLTKYSCVFSRASRTLRGAT